MNFINELYHRRKKLNQLRKQNNILFPNNFRRNIISSQLYQLYNHKNNQELKILNIEVNVVGRMINRRIIGKTSFVILKDTNGKIQLYVSQKDIYTNIDVYNMYFKKWDIGDILWAQGKVFKTNTNELSIRCNKIILLTKSIRSLPDKFHGITNQEIKYRQRYLDLITNKKSFKTFKTRSLIIREIRNFMNDLDFIEVETPIMHSSPGGAIAKPFITHHNALNIDVYLRVAPELYLKQLIIGGFEKIFEINKSFRNEGLSSYHNPEFTMMEIYMAYSDYKDLIKLIKKLFLRIANKITGQDYIKYNNYIFNFNKPFIIMTMKESISYYLKIEIKEIENIKSLINIIKDLNIKINDDWEIGKIQTKIFEEKIEKYLIQPTIITNYPLEVSPLARSNDNNILITDRFELFIGGYEICNGFSELNDPEIQKERFIKQNKNMQNKLKNNHIFYDKEYITALEYGLPPTAGVGIGIDRLIMLFTNNQNIKDVILFPTLKPQK